MDSGVAIPLGIVVSRERQEHSWDAALRWHPVAVLLDPPPRADWREVSRGRDFVHYHAATLVLTLNRKNAMHYRVNLANGVPSLYLIVRQRPGAGADVPIDIAHVSASPFEIEEYIKDSSDHIERVPMPAELVAQVERFLVEAASDTAPHTALRGRRDDRSDTSSFSSSFGLDQLGGFMPRTELGE